MPEIEDKRVFPLIQQRIKKFLENLLAPLALQSRVVLRLLTSFTHGQHVTDSVIQYTGGS